MKPFQANGKHPLSPPQIGTPDPKKSLLEIPINPNRFELPPSPSNSTVPPSLPSPAVHSTWDCLKRFDKTLTQAKDNFKVIANNPDVKNSPFFAVVSSLFPVFDELENVLNSISNDQCENVSKIEKASLSLQNTEKSLENFQSSQSILAEKQTLSSELRTSTLTVKTANFPLPPNIKTEVEIFDTIEQKIKLLGNDPSLIRIVPLKLKATNDKLPVNFQCRDHLTKLRLENSLRNNQIETSFHWPAPMYNFISKIRNQYKDAKVDGTPPPHERMVKIRPSRNCDKILVHFKSSLTTPPGTESHKWIFVEALSLPISAKAVGNNPNPCISSKIDLTPFLPKEYNF